MSAAMSEQARERHEHRECARKLLVRVPAAPRSEYGRNAEAWRIGYAAQAAGFSTKARDYYAAENFYAGCRRAFRRGVECAQAHLAVLEVSP